MGSSLDLLRHRKNDVALQELARVYVVDALKRWEPRVQVTSAKVIFEREQGVDVLAIRFRYDIVTSGTVILLGLEQAVRV